MTGIMVLWYRRDFWVFSILSCSTTTTISTVTESSQL